MKKLLVIFCIFVILIVSFTPASAKEGYPPSKMFVIDRIDYADRKIGFYINLFEYAFFYLPEDARINIPWINGPASFEDLEEGQWFKLGKYEIYNRVSITLRVVYPYYNGQD